jgi:hypothetical protein
MSTDLYRLERTVLGERLVPVPRPEEATHVAVALLRRVSEERARETAMLRAEKAQATARIHDLEIKLGRAIHNVDQSESLAAQEKTEADQLREEAGRVRVALGKLVEKNSALIGEKKQLKDALIGKHELPAVHYKIEFTRDEEAYEHVTYVLDAFPDKAHTPEAIAEARRHAQARGGQLRQLRLDMVAWRAIVQLPLGE